MALEGTELLGSKRDVFPTEWYYSSVEVRAVLG